MLNSKINWGARPSRSLTSASRASSPSRASSLALSLQLLAFSLASAIDPSGFQSASATGSTSAVAYFPAGAGPIKLTSLDVTSDLSSSIFGWAFGSAPATFAAAAISSATNVTIYGAPLAASDVALFQNAANGVTAATVLNITTNSNAIITLMYPLGTNLAAGDNVQRRLSAALTLLEPSTTNTTVFQVNSVSGLAADEWVVAEGGSRYATGKVSAASTVTGKYLATTLPLPRAIAAGDRLYEITTNVLSVSLATNAAASNLTFAATTGFSPDDRVLLTTSAGDLLVATVFDTNATTLTLTAPVGLAVSSNDTVNLLTSSNYTNLLSAPVGSSTLVLNSSTGLTTNDNVVITQTGQNSFRMVIATTGTSTNLPTIVLTGGLPIALPVGAAFHELTNSWTLRVAALAADTSITLTNSTALSPADNIVLLPATGGVFENTVNTTNGTLVTTSVNFTGQIGQAMAAGDSLYKLGTENTTIVGATTLRLNGTAIRAADQGRPVRLRVTGTSACSINNATVQYGP